MKNIMKPVFFILSFSLFVIGCVNNNQEKIQNSSINERVDSLISLMSIEEKVGQMTQLNLDVLSVGEIYKLEEPHRLDEKKIRKAIVDYKIGSVLNCGGHTYTREHWHEIINKIQVTAQKETRLKIPILYGIDAIHGVNYTIGSTLFPQQLSQAATWNPEIVEEIASITAYETRASGIPWNFSPVLDLGRQPLWSRFFETYGEDVHLAKTMTKACIIGYQGKDVSNNKKVAACMKHFLGYSFSMSGKDRTPAWIPERQLREYFLPTFKEAIAAGAKTIMINSGELNGIPVHADSTILTNLLRKELKFTGVAVTDWEDIIKLHKLHKVAGTLKEAVKMSINAGIDMSMVPNDFEFSDLLIQLVKEKQVPMSRIDEAVKRILTLKLELGLFEKPINHFADYSDFGSKKHSEVSYRAATESITLLKNKNEILPLKSNQRFLICGPGANSLNILNGAWTHTWQGLDTNYNSKNKLTPLQAIYKEIGKENIEYTNSCTLDSINDLSSAIRKAKKVDKIIVFLGEIPCTEKPGDIEDLTLPRAQVEFVKQLSTCGKPIILVMTFNRPRLITEIEPLADACLLTYLPGDEGGRAISDMLFGKINPSGKLPFTYPRYSGSLLPYDHKHTERLDKKFGENAFDPLFEFGYGLSYTKFEYSELKLSLTTLKQNDTILISVKIKNKGLLEGKEVVQLYSTDCVASITPSVKKLVAFNKINLKPGETKEVKFKLSAVNFSFIGLNNKPVTEPGDFELRVDTLKAKFIYQ